MPATPADLFRRLDDLGVSHSTLTHPAVFTVAEAKEKRGRIPGAHTKNLFLRDKKGAMWLLCCLESREVDLRGLAKEVGARQRLSFASERRLKEYLGVRPGAVSPLAVINDREGAVSVVLDDALLQVGTVNLHPLDNTMTTAMSPEGLLRFLEAEAHPPRMLAMG